MNEPEKFEVIFSMTRHWGGLQNVSVRYFPAYGTMQIKTIHDRDFRWADYWQRAEVLTAPNFKKLYNEYEAQKRT